MDTTSPITNEALSLLSARGISEQTAVRVGLKSVSINDGPQFRQGVWVEIPFYIGTEIVNKKYRRLDDKQFTQSKGGEQTWYNYNVLTDPTLKDQPLIVVEGEMDALAAMQSGFQRVVSVPSGAPTTQTEDVFEAKRYEYINESYDDLKDIETVVIAVDNDRKGQFLAQDLSIRLGKSRCKRVVFPFQSPARERRCKDLNEVLQIYNEDVVVQAIEKARWVDVDGVYRMSDLPPIAERETYSIHMNCDDYDSPASVKFRLGDFTVVTGIPGHGKSTFVNDLICRQVKHNGFRAAFASFEQEPQTDHQRALQAWAKSSGCAYTTQEANEWIDDNFVFMVPSADDAPTLDWMFEKMATAVRRYDCRIIVVDPWNEMEHKKNRSQSLTEYVGDAVRQFKRFAKANNVHLIIVTHPAKMKPNRDGTFPVPTPYDISDSQHWYNKADLILIVYKESDEHTLIRVAKVKYHGVIGHPGDLWYTFSDYEKRFTSCPSPLELEVALKHG